MKLGLGLYAGMTNRENLQFAKQVGASYIVQHLPGPETLPSTSQGYWSYEDLKALVDLVRSEGLQLYAIENFPPEHWSDVLLDGPRKREQMENLKRTIRNMGKAGIPVMGYYFSLAGVWGRVRGPFARGGAESVGYLADRAPEETPLPLGEVWGRRYDPDAPEGTLPPIDRETLWERLEWFLRELVPVAEEAGVRLAAHPDDPPLPELRGTPRLITHPDHYERLLAAAPSWANALEFCQGTVAEMTEADVYAAIRRYAREHIAYVHFRNVVGKVPHYKEVFLDEGDVDMIRALQIYHEVGYTGLLIPDHTPRVQCAAPWHAGMAYALGYLRGAMQALGIPIDE